MLMNLLCKNMKDKITISTVAEQANVSLGTVSRVLKNDPTVSKVLVARVLETIEALDYKPIRNTRSANPKNPLKNKNICCPGNTTPGTSSPCAGNATRPATKNLKFQHSLSNPNLIYHELDTENHQQNCKKQKQSG